MMFSTKTESTEDFFNDEADMQEVRNVEALKKSAVNKVKAFFVNTVGLTAAEADAFFE